MHGDVHVSVLVACDRPDGDLSARLSDTFADGQVFHAGEALPRADLRDGRISRPLVSDDPSDATPSPPLVGP